MVSTRAGVIPFKELLRIRQSHFSFFDHADKPQSKTSAFPVETKATSVETASLRNKTTPSTVPETPELVNDKYSDISVVCADVFEMHEKELQLGHKEATNAKGRLKKHVLFWEKIGANQFVIDTLTHGYKIHFLQTPPMSVSKNNRSALENISFVSEAVDELLRNGCVVKTPFVPHVVNLLCVSINRSGKKRLILDLRKVNKFVWKEKITFEDWKTGLYGGTKVTWKIYFILRAHAVAKTCARNK